MLKNDIEHKKICSIYIFSSCFRVTFHMRYVFFIIRYINRSFSYYFLFDVSLIFLWYSFGASLPILCSLFGPSLSLVWTLFAYLLPFACCFSVYSLLFRWYFSAYSLLFLCLFFAVSLVFLCLFSAVSLVFLCCFMGRKAKKQQENIHEQVNFVPTKSEYKLQT